MTQSVTAPAPDHEQLATRVRAMYRDVAERPGAGYHFELGRALAERLGYPAGQLDAVPAGAVESFAGVGYFFDLLDLHRGESVVDLGSGRLRRAHLHVARARARQPLVDGREPPLVIVGGIELALVFHRRRQRQRLAAAAGAEIEHLLAGLCLGEQRRELRAQFGIARRLRRADDGHHAAERGR